MTSHASTASAPERFELRPVQFSRLTRRGIILGLSLSQLIVLAVALLTVVIGLYTNGGAGLALVVARVGVARSGRMGARRRAEAHRVGAHRHPVDAPHPGEADPIPPARCEGPPRRHARAPRRHGRAQGMGRSRSRGGDDPRPARADPHRGVRGAASRVRAPWTPPSSSAASPAGAECSPPPADQVASPAFRSWSAPSQIPDPDSQNGGGSTAPTTAPGRRPPTENSSSGPAPQAERHATTVSLSIDMRAAGGQIRSAGGGMKGAAAVLRQEMQSFQTALRSAELRMTGWLTPGDVALVLRITLRSRCGPRTRTARRGGPGSRDRWPGRGE